MVAERMCFIHIGTHKTGTTSIQWFLRANRAVFARCGVLIPRSGGSENDAGHHDLTQELLGVTDGSGPRGGLAQLVDELRASSEPHACISCEDFALLARNADALRRVSDAVVAAGFKPVILVYLRPQVSFVVSIYAQIVANGWGKSFATYLEQVLEHGSFLWNGSLGPPFRYDELLSAFSAVFGSDSIVVHRYRSMAKKNALLDSFAASVIGPPSRAIEFRYPPNRTNQSLTFGGVLRHFDVDLEADDLRLAPLTVPELMALAWSFAFGNLKVAWRYGVFVPPFESRDFVLALPIRFGRRWTVALAGARRAIRAGPKAHDPVTEYRNADAAVPLRSR